MSETTGKGPAEEPRSEQEQAEERVLHAAEETIHEMKDAMATMMGAQTRMMQAFIDMRLSYLKVMRAGLEDPMATFNMMSENMQDVAKAMNRKNRS